MFDQDYSWPTEKAAIALIASTAEPLYACPAAGATLDATAGVQQVELTWPGVPPVTDYVVERADGGCGGAFAGIASTATGSFTAQRHRQHHQRLASRRRQQGQAVRDRRLV
jgi:hypothetical protein